MNTAAKIPVTSLSCLSRDIARDRTLLTREQEFALGRVVRSDDASPGEREAAIKELMEKNVCLVIHISKRARKANEDLGDLVSDGTIGLRRAAERFDPSRGFRFATYASRWILQAISRGREAEGRGRPVRVPSHAAHKFNRVLLLRAESMARGEDISYAEAGRRLGLGRLAAVIERAGARGYQGGVSLVAGPDRHAADDGDPDDHAADWLDLFPVRDDDDCERAEAVGLMRSLLRRLGPRERAIVRAFHGFEGRDPSRVGPELAARYGISRQRVHQIKRSAEAKLRLWAEEAGCS